MKKQTLKFIAMSFAITVLASCSSNSISGSIGDEKLAAEQNASEDNKVSVANLEKGLLIDGAVKKTGTPPAPNNNIDFTLSGDNKTGFQKAGIKIKFSGIDDVQGAYIRFKDVDGNPTTNYFDVPATSFGYKGSSKKKKDVFFHSSKSKANTRAITVNFTDVIPPGTFCYDICIYDNANNVSQIETVCVTIESWGGNAAMVGDWHMESYTDSKIETQELSCVNGGSVIIETEEKVVSTDITFSLKDNGAYSDLVKREFNSLNYDETINTCSVVFGDLEKDDFKRTGNWAFNEDKNELTIVMFKYEDLLDANNSEEYEFGTSFFSGIKLKEITEDTMILEEEVENAGRTFTYFFKRI